MSATDGQMVLLTKEPLTPTDIITVGTEYLSPNDAPEMVSDPPSAGLVASIKDNGVLMPLYVKQVKSGEVTEYTVVDGVRRLKAARKVGLKEVPVFVLAPGVSAAEALTLVMNEHRSENPLSFLYAVRMLRERAKAGGAALSAHSISEQLHINIHTVNRFLRLEENLHDGLRGFMEAGKMRVSVAEQAAKLPQAKQAELYQAAMDGMWKRITGDEVRKVQEKGAADALATLDDAVFADPTPVSDLKGIHLNNLVGQEWSGAFAPTGPIEPPVTASVGVDPAAPGKDTTTAVLVTENKLTLAQQRQVFRDQVRDKLKGALALVQDVDHDPTVGPVFHWRVPEYLQTLLDRWVDAKPEKIKAAAK